MNIKLFFEAIIKFILGLVIIGLLIFVPANTINYWNGWLFMGILFVPMFIAGLILLAKNPALLKSRLQAKEKQKEHSGQGRLKVTGVRWAESASRLALGGLVKVIGKPKTMIKQATERELQFEVTKKGGLVLNDDNADTRQFVEQCYRTASFLVNPIVDWLDDEVWDFLRYYGCRSNPLYAEGKKRIGCVGCSMQGFCGMKNDFARWPKFKENYIRAFDRMIIRRKERGLPSVWNSGEECFTWWVGDDPNQLSLFDMDDDSLFEAGVL